MTKHAASHAPSTGLLRSRGGHARVTYVVTQGDVLFKRASAK